MTYRHLVRGDAADLTVGPLLGSSRNDFTGLSQDDGLLAATQAAVQATATYEVVPDPPAGSVLPVQAGTLGIVVGGSNPVTLTDFNVGNVALFANSGNDTLVARAAGDTLVGGSGNDTFFTSVNPESVYLGSGQNTAVIKGATTLVASTGTDTVFAGSGSVVYGGKIGSSMQIVATAPVIVVGGDGQLTVFEGSSSGGEVFGGTGTTTYVGGTGVNGGDTFVGGSGTSVVYAGAGSDVIYGGTGTGTFVGAANGHTTIVAGLGPAAVYYGNQNTVFLSGSANDVASHYGAIGRPSTVVASNSSGNDLFVMGTGNNNLYEGSGSTTTYLGSGPSAIVGGTGTDLYVAVNGQADRGDDDLYNFKLGIDHIQLAGFAAGEVQNDLATAQVSGGSTFVSLSDHAAIQFVGVTGVTASSFIS